MSNPFRPDEANEPLIAQAADTAAQNFHHQVYKLHAENDVVLQDGNTVSDKSEPVNSTISKLSREERAERFLHAVVVKLGRPWDELAAQITNSREDYVKQNGEEDPGYYRRRRFKRQTEVTLNEVRTEKFYFQITPCARTAISKQSLNDFATIAEYYGFGVKQKPITLHEDIELTMKKRMEASKGFFYGTSDGVTIKKPNKSGS